MKTKEVNNEEMANVNEAATVENVTNVEAQDGAQVDETPKNSDEAEGEGENDEASELEVKASQILKVRMPNLAEAGLNFEKRTGNFFRATLIKVTDKDGNPEYDETGAQKEKISRLTVELVDENGKPTEEATKCADEIRIKRAAGLVLRAETQREKLQKDVEEARKALEEAENAYVAFESEVNEASEIVAEYEIPESVKATRTPKTKILEAEVQKKIDENAKLRALLIAAGIDPDAAMNE